MNAIPSVLMKLIAPPPCSGRRDASDDTEREAGGQQVRHLPDRRLDGRSNPRVRPPDGNTMFPMSTVDHRRDHVWVRTPVGLRCAYQYCDARPGAGRRTPIDAAIWLGLGYLVLLGAYRVRRLVRHGPS